MTRRIGVLFATAMAVALCAGCITVPISTFSARTALTEEVIEPARSVWTGEKVALITLSGQISGETQKGLFGRQSTVVSIKDQLRMAERDRRVKAVVLRLDSPGGDVTASDIIYREIKLFQKKRKIPVYVAMMDLAASGGYYIAMAGDKVFAHPTTITGSIGVIAVLPKLQPLAKKIGIEMRVVKSGATKDIGSFWRDFAPGEREIIQGMIDEMYERFLVVVGEGRPELDAKTIRKLADGRPYTAPQAVELGLIDGIAYLDEVIEKARDAAGLEDAKVVVYKKPFDYKGHIYAGGETLPVELRSPLGQIEATIQQLLRPRFQYLWAP